MVSFTRTGNARPPTAPSTSVFRCHVCDPRRLAALPAFRNDYDCVIACRGTNERMERHSCRFANVASVLAEKRRQGFTADSQRPSRMSLWPDARNGADRQRGPNGCGLRPTRSALRMDDDLCARAGSFLSHIKKATTSALFTIRAVLEWGGQRIISNFDSNSNHYRFRQQQRHRHACARRRGWGRFINFPFFPILGRGLQLSQRNIRSPQILECVNAGKPFGMVLHGDCDRLPPVGSFFDSPVTPIPRPDSRSGHVR